MASTSNSTRGCQRKRKLDEIHEDLKYDLAFKHLESPKKFRGAAKKYLSHADWSSHTEAFDIMDRLEANGQLAPGQYGVLRQIGHKITESKFVEAIDEAEKEIVKSEVKEDDSQLLYSSNEKINNIITQTKREIDVHLSDRSYVHLPVVHHGLEILQQSGLLVLVGRSGCGKTKCALQILSQANQVRVLKLQSLHEWSEMVEMTVENWVWYDDVFEHEFIDKNRSVIATIKACVQDGSSKVIFTVTDEVYEQNRPSFQKFFPLESVVDFEQPHHSLCIEMKYKILMSHLHVNDVEIKNMVRPFSSSTSNETKDKNEIYESDIREIILKKPLLGFPQACYVFCSDFRYLQKGHTFFDDPSKELLNAITKMSSFFEDQFVTLVYTFRNGGDLDLKNIDDSKVSDLLQTLSISNPGDIEAYMRRAIDRMKGKYLIELPLDFFRFSHSSIYKAVAISYARLSRKAKIDTISSLSNTCINEIVKPAICDKMEFGAIEVGKDLYSELANIIAQRLKDNDCSLFKCDIFSDEEFINTFAPMYQISENHLNEHLRHLFRYGRICLVQRTLYSHGLTIDCLDERKFVQILKESSIHNQLQGIHFLLNGKGNSNQKTNAIIDCMKYSRQTNAVFSIFIQRLTLAELDEDQLQTVSRILARDESLVNFEYFINNFLDLNNEKILQTLAKTIGRRNAKTCLNTFCNKFQSKREIIILHVIEGACTGGHNDLLTWAMEHYPELVKSHVTILLQHVEIPTTLEILLKQYSCHLRPQDYSETLNYLCERGKSLCVKVLIDNWPNSTDSDIEKALCSALKEKHFVTVDVIRESFSIPHEMITEVISAMKGNGETRSHSAYPSTNTPRPPSVLSRKNYTPCISDMYTQRCNDRKLCVMRCLSKQYLSIERNVYSRAYRLSSLVHDNSISLADKLQKCQEILAEEPTIYEDLIFESAVHSCYREEFLFMFLVKYPSIWEKIFLSCRNDKKRCQSLLINIQKFWKKTGRQFLPSVVDFLIRNEENISDFIRILTAAECIVDIEEFISALEPIIELHLEIAESFLINIEELTLHSSTIVPLKLSCKRNHINVFRFIWSRSENQKDIIYDFLLKDIVDQNGAVINIMLSDITSNVSLSQIFVGCLQHGASRWISNLKLTHRQQILESINLVLDEINQNGDTKSFDLMIQFFGFKRKELIDILQKACKNGWKLVLDCILKMKIDLTGRRIVKSIQTLSENGHQDIVICFEESLKNETQTKRQYDKVLDAIVSTCTGADCIMQKCFLQRLVLIPRFAAYVFSQKIILVIGIDFFINQLSAILTHLDRVLPYMKDSDIGRLVPSLTVCQQNQIIEIILESPLTKPCFSILARFLPCCKEVEPDVGKLLIDKVLSNKKCKMGKDCGIILTYIFDKFSSLIKNDILSNYLKSNLTRTLVFDSKIKITAFELARKRGLDISNTVKQNFYEACSKIHGNYYYRQRVHAFVQHLIDSDYLDQSQKAEGLQLCLLGDGIRNHKIAIMIMRKDKLSLQVDKAGLFKRICECEDIEHELVKCVLELYCNDIDDLSLEVGFKRLLKHNADLCIESKIIVNTIVSRRINIAGNVPFVFGEICYWIETDSSIALLKYILEMYSDLIKENVVEGFNNALTRSNSSCALELCKAFPERITLSEYILFYFLNYRLFNKKPELLVELSKVLHVDSEICMRFSKVQIQKNERWRTISYMFGSSITADMKWKLLRLWLDDYYFSYYPQPYWLSDADIKLTDEQVTFLRQKYPSNKVNKILEICYQN